MRRLVSIAAVALAAAGVLSARSVMQAPAPGEGEKKLIDLKSDLMGPVAPGDSVVFLVGNFAAQHNGAVITCDSAVRYSDTLSYTHLRAHETGRDPVCRLLLEKKNVIR